MATCYRRTLIEWTSPVKTWGSYGYMSQPSYTCGDYPFAFTETPITSVTLEGSGAGNYMTGSWVVGANFGTTTTSPSVYIMNTNSNETYDKGGYLTTRAIGKWK